MDVATDKDSPDIPNPEYSTMVEAAELIDDLMGGTPAMQAAGKKWLPKMEEEEWGLYNVRLENSVLFGRFKAAVESLSARPFAKPSQVRNIEKLPKQLTDLQYAVDDEQRNVTSFLKHCMSIGIKRGLVHMLVDYPTVTAANLAEERALGLRPIIIAIDPMDLIAWRYEKALNGVKTLTQIRIKETATESAGKFGSVIKNRVRVIYAGTPGIVYESGNPTATVGPSGAGKWELWENTGEKGKDAWVMIQDGPWTIGKISLVTVYMNKTGFMTGKSPLEDLAWMNRAHWQSMSDHRRNLAFARVGTLFGKGLSEEERKRKIVVGVNHAFLCGSPDADMKIIEHSGSAVQAGENELRHLEDQMDAIAKGPLMLRSSGDATATGKAIDEGKGQCELEAWAGLLEIGFDQALELDCEWIKAEMPDDVSTAINKEFALLGRTDRDMDHLRDGYDRGVVDRRRYAEGFILRDIIPRDTNVDEMLDNVSREGPALGMAGRENEEEEDEDVDEGEGD